jgi:hypothetical protein
MTPMTDFTVKIVPNEQGNPSGKLAAAELHFTAGPLEGLSSLAYRSNTHGNHSRCRAIRAATSAPTTRTSC